MFLLFFLDSDYVVYFCRDEEPHGGILRPLTPTHFPFLTSVKSRNTFVFAADYLGFLTQRNNSSSNVHSDDLTILKIHYIPESEDDDDSIDRLWRILPQIPVSVTEFGLPLCLIDRSEDYAYMCVGSMPQLKRLNCSLSNDSRIETVEEYGLFADERTLSRLSFCAHLKSVCLCVRDLRSCSSTIKTLIKSCPKLKQIRLFTPKLNETTSKQIINDFETEIRHGKVDMSIEDDIDVPRLISRVTWTIIG